MKLLRNIMILAIALASVNAHADSKKIIKWVDKNGVTQYGDKPPMPHITRRSSVLNKQGVVIEKIEPKYATTEEDKALASQSRYDHAILASYNSIEEIDIARKRNIKIDELTLVALEDKHKKLNSQLQKNNIQLLEFAKKNQPAPIDTASAIEINMKDIARLEKQITKKQQVIEKINTRYEKDKVRFAQLESRKGNLNDIKYNNKNIAELKLWKADAQKRLSAYESGNLKYTRRGQSVPKHIQEGLVRTTKEVESANKEIAAGKLAIKRNKLQISK